MENMKNGSLSDDAIMMDNYHIYYCTRNTHAHHASRHLFAATVIFDCVHCVD